MHSTMAKKTDTALSAEVQKAARQTAPALGVLQRGKPPVDLGRAVVEAFLTSERVNQLLLENLDKKSWRKAAPNSLE